MSRSNSAGGLSVYLVCSQFAHRERILASLEGHFEKLTPISFKGERISDRHRIIRPRPNPTGVLSRIGLRNLKRRIDSYLYFPSAANLSVARARPLLAELIGADIRQGLGVCLIQATPPHGPCTLGLYLKQQFPELRWIVDWQDLWSFDDAYRDRIPGIYSNRLLRLEKSILDNCDLNVTTNARAARVLHDRYGVPDEKLLHIAHPFLPENLAALQGDSRDRPAGDRRRTVKIGFLGRLSKPPKVPGPRVLKAITDAIDAGVDIELHILGDRSELTRKHLAAIGCDKIFLYQREAHLDALKQMAGFDFLLLALDDLENCRIIMHAKWPDYLILNRPVIAMVPEDSFIADAVLKTRAGVVLDTASDWGADLTRIVRAYQQGEFRFDPDQEEIARYSWDSISREWIEAINGKTAASA